MSRRSWPSPFKQSVKRRICSLFSAAVNGSASKLGASKSNSPLRLEMRSDCSLIVSMALFLAMRAIQVIGEASAGLKDAALVQIKM